MKKIETSLETLKADISAFYKVDQHHFIIMNGVDLGENMELQWFFCDYAPPCNMTMFHTIAAHGATIPSIKSIIPASWAAEAELVDLLDLVIENTEKGFVLEQDSIQSPLRKNK